MRQFIPVIILIYCLTALPKPVCAQSNFESGFIITKTGDTLFGYIDFRDWAQGPFTIDFKNDPSAQSTQLTPTTINGFSVHDELYRSLFVWLDKSPYETSSLNLTPERQLVAGKIFTQVLVQAPEGTNLFYQKDETGKEHFLCNYHDSIVELRRIEYIDISTITHITIEEWVLRLMEITADCHELLDETNHLEFSIADFSAFIVSYNECMEKDVLYVYEENFSQVAFGFLAGASMARINYSVKLQGEYFAEATYPLYPGFTAGVFYDFDLPQRRETWWLCNQLNLHYFKSEGTYEGMLGLVAQHANITFTQLDLKLTTTIKVQANTNILKPYFKFGVTNSIARVNKNETQMVNEDTFSGEIDTVYYFNDIQKNRYHYGATISAGMNFNNKLYFELGYEKGFHISDYLNYSSSEDDIYATLFFRL